MNVPAASCEFIRKMSSVNGDRPRTLVHLDVADFAVAVERMADSRLKDRPVIIAPERASRALVFDMSEEAYQGGVRKGMPLQRALRCCRDAKVLPPRPDRYERVMTDLFRESLSYSPLIETGEADGHLFIDITGTGRLFGPPADVAWRMYKGIRDRLGLTPAWSVAPNKLVAKAATRVVKPAGEYVVNHGDESAFLSPLPVGLLPGIEREDLVRLREFNLAVVRQVAALTLDQLGVPFGRRAGLIFDAVRGVDVSPVLPAEARPSWIAAEHVFGEDSNDVAALERAVYGLAENIGLELRQRGRVARTLALMLEHADGLRRFRQLAVRPPSGNDITLFETARAVLYRAWTRRVRVRRIRLTCVKPVLPPAQMELFPSASDAMEQKRDVLIHAVDHIRARFGYDSIHMGHTLPAA
jgi:DNA polymerase IV